MMQKTLTRIHDLKLPTAILGACLLQDHNQMVAACMDGIYRVDLSGKSHQRIAEHDSYVSSAVFLPAARMFVTGGYDGKLKWFSAQDNALIREQKVHSFWSWDLAASANGRWLASVTGQYLAGDYRYAPAKETEPSVRILDASDGRVAYSLPHTPSVQSVVFSHDSQWVAAGNLMGQVRVWEVASGVEVGGFESKDFTSWGIIKSHCYLGGIFAMEFTPDNQELIVCGMGDMRDPMAGNGKQLWQRWNWKESKLVSQTLDKQSGEGLMEALCVHPANDSFVMGGRLRGGDWNGALFDLASGERLGTIKSGYRITEFLFNERGELIVVGGQGQPGKNDQGKFSDFGRIEVYEIKS
ncbi:MAG: WD40 repeat domain-containing protein [Pirellula sp.]